MKYTIYRAVVSAQFTALYTQFGQLDIICQMGSKNASELANSGKDAYSMTLLRRWAGFIVVTLDKHMI